MALACLSSARPPFFSFDHSAHFPSLFEGGGHVWVFLHDPGTQQAGKKEDEYRTETACGLQSLKRLLPGPGPEHCPARTRCSANVCRMNNCLKLNVGGRGRCCWRNCSLGLVSRLAQTTRRTWGAMAGNLRKLSPAGLESI